CLAARHRLVLGRRGQRHGGAAVAGLPALAGRRRGLSRGDRRCRRGHRQRAEVRLGAASRSREAPAAGGHRRVPARRPGSRAFAVAAIPGALAVSMMFAVREPSTASREPAGASREPQVASRIPPSLLLAIGIFTLGNSTDALLVLRASQLGVPTVQLPLLWML